MRTADRGGSEPDSIAARIVSTGSAMGAPVEKPQEETLASAVARQPAPSRAAGLAATCFSAFTGLGPLLSSSHPAIDAKVIAAAAAKRIKPLRIPPLIRFRWRNYGKTSTTGRGSD